LSQQACQAAAVAAAGYVAQQAAVASATPAATYRTNPTAGVVAYTAYQPPQVSASYGSDTYHQTNSFQFATSMPNPVHTFAVGGKPATAYYGQPACVAPPVTYTVSDPHYQARPVYTTTSNISLSHGGPGKIKTENQSTSE
jgi:hypothetical protein